MYVYIYIYVAGYLISFIKTYGLDQLDSYVLIDLEYGKKSTLWDLKWFGKYRVKPLIFGGSQVILRLGKL